MAPGSASLNNITFVMPKVGLLQAHCFNNKVAFRLDFPDKPVTACNYTSAPLTANLGTSLGTRLSRIAYNSAVELVLQDTDLFAAEYPSFHLHGTPSRYKIFASERPGEVLTWLIHRKGTLLAFQQEVGLQFDFRLIIHSSCLVHALSSRTPHHLGA